MFYLTLNEFFQTSNDSNLAYVGTKIFVGRIGFLDHGIRFLELGYLGFELL